MPILYNKTADFLLSKEYPGVKQLTLSLSWRERSTDGADFDLDACAFLLDYSNEVPMHSEFVFYNNLRSGDGSVILDGDERTGSATKQAALVCEELKIDLTQVRPDIQKIIFVVTLFEGNERYQNFGMVSDAWVSIKDAVNNKEIAKIDLSEDAAEQNSLVFTGLFRSGSDWQFKTIEKGFEGGLAVIAKKYGVGIRPTN